MDEPKEGEFTFRDKRRRHEEEEETGGRGEPAPASTGASGKAPGPGAGGGESGPSAPPIDFSTFVLSLASSAVYHMGGFQDPVSGKTSINLDLAKQSIDIISMIEEKTTGNLTDEEAKLLSHTLYDLRMRFVEASRGAGK